MKKILFLFFVLNICTNIKSQNPQFAVVRPDGTTFICPSFDSAYNKASNDDNIYLPNGNYYLQYMLNKRLNIFGTGHHPDSTLATGKTHINGTLLIGNGGSGSLIEGVQISGGIYMYYTGLQVKDIVIKRCNITGTIDFNPTGTSLQDSLPTNVLITECLVEDINFGNSNGNFISKSLLSHGASNGNYPYYLVRNTNFENNIFLPYWNYKFSPSNCTFKNNIFLTTNYFINACLNSFYNNILVGANSFDPSNSCLNTITEVNTISVSSVDDIFINYNYSAYPYLCNFHLKATCPGINAGTDGTDIGIYGTSAPTSEGWVPSNPHIYFKQVAPQTNSNGGLQIQFKVRTNN